MGREWSTAHESPRKRGMVHHHHVCALYASLRGPKARGSGRCACMCKRGRAAEWGMRLRSPRVGGSPLDVLSVTHFFGCAACLTGSRGRGEGGTAGP